MIAADVRRGQLGLTPAALEVRGEERAVVIDVDRYHDCEAIVMPPAEARALAAKIVLAADAVEAAA